MIKEERKEYLRKWAAENNEKVKESNRKWRAENPEKVNEIQRIWRAKNPEKVNEIQRIWRAKNHEKVFKNNVKGNLKKQLGEMPNSELVEIKTIIIKTKRLCKTLKN